jgi:general L-amino acid transport system substrate-binding protein
MLTVIRASLLSAICAIAAFTPTPAGAADQETLAIVKSRGYLVCGSSQGVPGFSSPDREGRWSGFDIDFCRAMAAAIFRDPSKTRYVPLSSKDRFTALQSGDVDILPRTITWMFSRDVQLGLDFTAITYYDGAGFVVPAKSGIKSAKELNGASVCLPTGTTTELAIADFARVNHITLKSVTYTSFDEAVTAYAAGRCDAFSTDISQIYAHRLKLPDPMAHVVLPEVISKEPLSPAVRQGDSRWRDIATWTHFVMVTAEELGITQANVDEMRASTNPDIRRLLGSEGNFGETLGLTNDWGYQIIKSVGNYGEVFQRNLTAVLGIERGINQLWNKGGLQYAPPLR